MCANRLLVQAGVYEAFATKLAAAVAEVTVGNGQEAGVSQGPLIDQSALNKVEELVADAVQKRGPRVHRRAAPCLGRYFLPTYHSGRRDISVGLVSL